MNVYIRNLATALAETGIDVDIFTPATDSLRPAVEHPSPRVRMHNVAAGPLRKVPKEELPELAHAMVVETDRIRLRQPHRHYDLILAHYWLSGVAGTELSREWNVPLVHSKHTMAKVKNLVLQPGEKLEPQRREDGEYRTVDGATRLIANTGAEAAERVFHYDADRIDVTVAVGVTGLLVDGHAAADWAVALEALYDDPARRKRTGHTASVHARSSGWQRATIIESYRTAVQQHSARAELLAM
jgi:D-inositol-3-phosphate glycosyltransferase